MGATRARLAARTLRPIQSLGRLIENRFNTLVLSHAFRNKDVLGASCRTGDARLVVVNAALPSETQRRFVLAHELAHQVLDLGRVDLQTNVGTFKTTPTERRANAFATMLLAPDFALHEQLGPLEEETRFDWLERRVLEAFHRELISSSRSPSLRRSPRHSAGPRNRTVHLSGGDRRECSTA